MWVIGPACHETKTDCAGEGQQQCTTQNLYMQLSEGSQSRQTVKYGHDPRWTRYEESVLPKASSSLAVSFYRIKGTRTVGHRVCLIYVSLSYPLLILCCMEVARIALRRIILKYEVCWHTDKLFGVLSYIFVASPMRLFHVCSGLSQPRSIRYYILIL
jgi:uncharacterized membrane protein SirB2